MIEPGIDQGQPSTATETPNPIVKAVCPLLVVIVNYKSAELTIKCLKTLEPELARLPGARVTVVENASGDAEFLARAIPEHQWNGWVALHAADSNGGFARGNNLAIRPALASNDPPRYILLLNADTEVRPRAIQILIDFMDQNPTVGIAGSSFENFDGSDWPIAFRFFSPINELDRGLRFGPVTRLLKHHLVTKFMNQERAEPIDWVAGACMIVRREVFETAGLMDETYFLYFEEVDFCFQAQRKGWSCWYVPQSRVMHIGGQSTGLTERDLRPPRTPKYWFASRSYYFRKNYGFWGEVAADLAFGLGFAAWKVRRFVTRAPDLDPPHHLFDFWKHSIFFRPVFRIKNAKN